MNNSTAAGHTNVTDYLRQDYIRDYNNAELSHTERLHLSEMKKEHMRMKRQCPIQRQKEAQRHYYGFFNIIQVRKRKS